MAAQLNTAGIPQTDQYDYFAAHQSVYYPQSDLDRLYSMVYEGEKEYREKVWEREDSAYQRMVADMQKAGLNPWTGISSGGSPTSSTGSSPTSSAMQFLMAGYNLNAQAAERENSNTFKMLNVIAKLVSSLFK